VFPHGGTGLLIGQVEIGFMVGCFIGCVWMSVNEFLYLMCWGGLGIRQMRVGGGWNVSF
jgi:hypothetical protein